MAREIADSDDDSDFVVPPQPLTESALHKGSSDRDPVLDLSFDQFLSPTQQLSSYDGNHSAQKVDYCIKESSNDLSASCAKHSVSRLNISEESQNSMGRTTALKRSHALLEPGASAEKDRTLPATKAHKTYGRSQYHHFEDDLMAISTGQENGRCSALDGETSGHLAENRLSPEGESFIQNMWPDGIRHPLQDTQKNEPQRRSENGAMQTTTVNSSVGGHQSINIDYSGTGAGFDFNPFGTLSQVSLDGEPNAETEKVASLFRKSSNRGANTLALPLSGEDLKAGFENLASSNAHGENHETGPKAHEVSLAENDEELQLNSQTTKTERPTVCTNSEVGESPLLSKSAEQLIKDLSDDERTTKSKSRGLLTVAQLTDQDNPSITLMDPSLLTRKRSDRSLDPTSNTSEIIENCTAKTPDQGKRCGSESTSKIIQLPKKDLSSDLGLDDPDIIGLPVESYVPRPSRRRANQEKLNTGIAHQCQQEDEFTAPNRSVKSTNNAKGKKGKKGKRKKTATSTPTSTTLDFQTFNSEAKDETREIVSIEERPRDVKIETPHSLSQGNEGGSVDVVVVEHLRPSGGDVAASGMEMANAPCKKKISVDIPRLRETAIEEQPMPAAPTPKKKGRRSKKDVKVEEDPIHDDEIPTRQKEADPQRHALEMKDPNLPLGTNDINHVELDTPEDIDENGCSSRQELSPLVKDDFHTKMIDLPVKASNSTLSAKYRIGLSRRHFIPSLLRKVDRDKEPPKVSEKKEKLTKKQIEQREKEKLEREDGGEQDDIGVNGVKERGADGFLVEWDD